MRTLTLPEFERLCQKPNGRTVGHWLARHWARPAALRLTWWVVRWPITAHAVTRLALVIALAGVAVCAAGTPRGFVTGVLILHLWYVLDHVDGQVARFRRCETVSGVYFDFWMHHIVNLAVPIALGYGVAHESGELLWSAVGAALAVGLAGLALSDDCRYKAFHGMLAREGGWWRELPPDSTAATAVPIRLTRLARLRRIALGLCEFPNVLAALSILAVVRLAWPVVGLCVVQGWLCVMATLSWLGMLGRVGRHVAQGTIDAEYRAHHTVGDPASERHHA